MKRKCIVCGREDDYNSDLGWRNIMLPYGKGYDGWEEYAFLCSENCITIAGANVKSVKRYLKNNNKYPDGTFKID